MLSRVTNHRIPRHSFRIAQPPEIFGKPCSILRRNKLRHFFMNLAEGKNIIPPHMPTPAAGPCFTTKAEAP